MVFGKLWMRFTQEGGEARRWVKNFRWHAQRKRDGRCCWLASGLEHLASNPHVETRGKRKLLIPKEKREERFKILRQRARLVQKLKVLMLDPNEEDIDRIIVIGSEVEELKERMVDLGGIPKSWG